MYAAPLSAHAGHRRRGGAHLLLPAGIRGAVDGRAGLRRLRGWPHAVEYDTGLPEVLLDQLPLEEVKRRVAAGVKALEPKAWDEASKRGISFMGPSRALRQKHTRRANSYETFGARNPRFAASGDRDAARAAVARNRVFDAEYDQGWSHWGSGDRRRAVFPHGTWKMRVLHNARCRSPP